MKASCLGSYKFIMPTTVININHGDPFDVYIGRPSIFGNPFFLRREADRDACLARYRAYFLHRIGHDTEFRKAVRSLRNKRLACHCAPKKCHGDVIAEWVNAQE